MARCTSIFRREAPNPDPGNPYGYNWNQEMLALPGGYLIAPFRTTPYRVSVLNADWDRHMGRPGSHAGFRAPQAIHDGVSVDG